MSIPVIEQIDENDPDDFRAEKDEPSLEELSDQEN